MTAWKRLQISWSWIGNHEKRLRRNRDGKVGFISSCLGNCFIGTHISDTVNGKKRVISRAQLILP